MWQFLLGLFIGINISIFLYALILASRISDEK